MVASESGGSLLFYIAATTEAVSMVLVTERSDPHTPHELEGSSASGSGSLDPRPTEDLRAGEAAGSQLPEVYPAHGDTRS
jgi:hypothetical protein